jgi:hypothetical protein
MGKGWAPQSHTTFWTVRISMSRASRVRDDHCVPYARGPMGGPISISFSQFPLPAFPGLPEIPRQSKNRRERPSENAYGSNGTCTA